jgi:hypothetical protein
MLASSDVIYDNGFSIFLYMKLARVCVKHACADHERDFPPKSRPKKLVVALSVMMLSEAKYKRGGLNDIAVTKKVLQPVD